MTSKGPKPGSKLEQLGAMLAGKMKSGTSFRRPSLIEKQEQEQREKKELEE